MATSLVPPVSNSFLSIVGSGDPTAVIEAMRAAVSNQLCGCVQTYSDSAKQAMVRLDKLNGSPILTELDNLTHFLSPNGLSVAPSVDGGTSVMLGGASEANLQAELASLAFSLPVLSRYYVDTSTVKNGVQVSHTSTHLASPDEMTALKNGTIQSATMLGMTLNTSTVRNSDGSTTTYTYSPGTTVDTASIADIQALEGQITETKQALYGQISVETGRIQAFSDHIAQSLKDGDKLLDGVRDHEAKTDALRNGDLRKDIVTTTRKQTEEGQRIVQGDHQPGTGAIDPKRSRP